MRLSLKLRWKPLLCSYKLQSAMHMWGVINEWRQWAKTIQKSRAFDGKVAKEQPHCAIINLIQSCLSLSIWHSYFLKSPAPGPTCLMPRKESKVLYPPAPIFFCAPKQCGLDLAVWKGLSAALGGIQTKPTTMRWYLGSLGTAVGLLSS